MEKELITLANNNFTIDSREVAEMLGKEHKYVLRDIEGTDNVVGIIPTLESANLHSQNYFIPTTYKAGTREYKCYLVTKMGCELLGNKQQGEKGILFTAKYVERFNKMEAERKDHELLLAYKEIDKLQNLIEGFNESIDRARVQFKPSHKRKLDYNKMIKFLVNSEEEVTVVKDWVFGILNISKWEDTCVDDTPRILETINTVARLVAIKKVEQLSLF
ncbi:Rha family transcriptional regulator [uncultured Clostridium sp.]|uniref:Rha family transcriptional regulator n=1 Tax=uncultured Clostridium sp. TaxID=59620 RepID=UPI00260E7225|nr:Rha family transcriptional regulator [uncultured Clostridium sp.]